MLKLLSKRLGAQLLWESKIDNDTVVDKGYGCLSIKDFLSDKSR